MSDVSGPSESTFEINAEAIARAEHLIRARRSGDVDDLTDRLLQAQSDHPAAALMGLVLLADQALKDAAGGRGLDPDFYLRALGSWMIHQRQGDDQ